MPQTNLDAAYTRLEAGVIEAQYEASRRFFASPNALPLPDPLQAQVGGDENRATEAFARLVAHLAERGVQVQESDENLIALSGRAARRVAGENLERHIPEDQARPGTFLDTLRRRLFGEAEGEDSPETSPESEEASHELPDSVGVYNILTRTIYLKHALEPRMKLRVLVHEAAHAAAHSSPPRSRFNYVRREQEAEAVAYLVMCALDFDCGLVSFPYIAGYFGGPASLRRSKARILELAEHFVRALTAAPAAQA